MEVKIDKALEMKRLKNEIEYLRDAQQDRYDFEKIVGTSPALQRVLDIVKKVAKSNTTVLVRGETGTGKELIAGAIHHNSLRTSRNFVKVNCAALQENLLESELFGHEKGAFTGADKQRIGRFEQADGGTLFLDEIGDMSASTQAKILRVLQEHEFERLGDTPAMGGVGRDQPSTIVKIPPTGIPLEDVERSALIEALKMSNWVQKDAAELLSISPRVMNYKIKTLGIEFPRGRRAAPLD